MSEKLFETTSVFDWNFAEWLAKENKIIINSGGTYSSKTYSILQLFHIIATSEPKSVLTVVADTVPNLKKGAYRDFQNIISNPKCKRWITNINQTDKVVYYKNGSIIEFCSYMDSLDARSGKRQYLFINECNGVSFDVYQELATRTEKQIFLDFNPTSSFWVHTHVKTQPKAIFFRSWYVHNQQLGEDKIKEIESWRDSPIKYYQNRWRVMGQGKLGIPEGAVFTDWEAIDELPANITYRYIIDFGYNNDPCCISKIGHENNYIYAKVLCYETGMTTLDIAKRLYDLGISNSDTIIADGGGGGNMNIAQLRNLDGSLSNVPNYPTLSKGYNISPAIKGQGSINIGIDKLNQHRIFVTKDSAPAWSEFVNYVRVKLPSGEFGDPIDKHNHFCDTARYYAMARGRLF